MKKLPAGRQNFRELIVEDLLYIDKTRQIYDLVTTDKLYFLSRPRRFGKTLLMSTFSHWFRGEKELFQDLYVCKEVGNYSWESYPVLEFNFAAYGHKVTNLVEALTEQLEVYAQQFGVTIPSLSVSRQLEALVEQIAQKGKPVVLLIDEYDKPIVDFLTELPQARQNQKILRDFFSPLKGLDKNGCLHFLFITGVSKFSKVSLFSDLNNLTDLTIDPRTDDLLGITQEELLSYFDKHIEYTAQRMKLSVPKLLAGVKLWYNGYSFNGETKLYNPFSLLNFFSKHYFGNFWFATGTPTFLVETIRQRGIDPIELEELEVPETFFTKFSLEELGMAGLLFQTGYLTIKRIQQQYYERTYFLGYPNMEVRKAFLYNLVEAFTSKGNSIVGQVLVKMQRALEGGKVQQFVEQLETLLSDISYHMLPKPRKSKKQTAFNVWEGYFHTIVYLITSFMGLYVQTEITKHKGRLDLLAETDDFLYLMEFKLDEPAKNAIQQIKDRKYLQAYRNSPKTVYLVGIGFSKEERNVETWEAEIWERG